MIINGDKKLNSINALQTLFGEELSKKTKKTLLALDKKAQHEFESDVYLYVLNIKNDASKKTVLLFNPKFVKQYNELLIMYSGYIYSNFNTIAQTSKHIRYDFDEDNLLELGQMMLKKSEENPTIDDYTEFLNANLLKKTGGFLGRFEKLYNSGTPITPNEDKEKI